MRFEYGFLSTLFLCWLLVGSSGLCYSQSTVTLTLEEAIKTGLENNFDVQVMSAQKSIVDNNIHPGNAGLLPSLSSGGTGSISVNNTKIEFDGGIPPIEESGAKTISFGGSVDLNYNLFDGMQGIRRFQKLKLEGRKAEWQERLTMESVIIAIVSNFVESLKLQIQVALVNKSIEISNERVTRLKDRFEFGTATGLDLLNAQVDLDNDSASLVTLVLNYENGLRNLKFLSGGDLAGPYKLDTILPELDLPEKEELEAGFLSRNAAMNVSDLNIELSNADMLISKASKFPRLDMSSSYSYSNQHNDAGLILTNRTSGFNGGLSLTYNIFNGFQQKTQIENAVISSQIAKQQYKQDESRMRMEFANARHAFQSQSKLLDLRATAVQSAVSNFKRAQQALDLGQINGTQFREAQLNLLNAKFSKAEANFDLKLAEFELARVSGWLME